MARTFLIIDGYNLMHAAGLGRSSYGPGGLERSRMQLLKRLTNHLETGVASDAIIVFDSGTNSSNDPQQESTSRLSVRYSQNGLDADSEIELLLKSHSSPRQVLVVSSDHRLHKAARRRRAQCIDSEKFWSLLASGEGGWCSTRTKQKKPSTAESRKENSPHPAEEDFSAEFLNIDIAEIKRAVRKEGR